MTVIAAIMVVGVVASAPPPAPVVAPSTTPASAAAAIPDSTGTPATPAAPITPVPAPPPVDPAPAIRDAFQIAESLQGPLDGEWRLTDVQGRPLLILELCDPGAQRAGDAAALEGAWRDPNHLGAGGSGFLDQIDRQGDGLTIRFHEGGDAEAVEVSLRAGADRQWRGEISGAGARQRVVMNRF